MSADQCCTDREIAQLRAQLVVLREQTELSLTRLTRISQEINQERRRLRRQVGLDLGDQTQKTVEQNSVPNLRGRSAQSEALELLCANGLLRNTIRDEINTWWKRESTAGLRSPLQGQDGVDEQNLQRPDIHVESPELVVNLEHPQSSDQVGSNGTVSRDNGQAGQLPADTLATLGFIFGHHHNLPTLHGLVTRYGTGVSAFRRWLQRRQWIRRAAVSSPRPSDTTTGGDAA